MKHVAKVISFTVCTKNTLFNLTALVYVLCPILLLAVTVVPLPN